MISERDVIKVFMPFPNEDSGLAVKKHYYICDKIESNDKYLFKCQTKKANLIIKNGGIKKFMNNYYIIRPSSFVPFKRETAVDKQKVFKLQDTTVPKSYLSPEKPSEIPISTYKEIITAIRNRGFRYVEIDKPKFVSLNPDCI
ncbi:hypothetical protein [Streptococcus equinus]|nr:hypothetical protein [Streptococcus equinus]